MSHYYSGNVRKQFVSNKRLKIKAQRRQERRERIKNILLIAALIACYLAAGYMEGLPF